MPPTYQPTSVTRPAPQSVNNQSVRDPQSGVQTHVVVNVINNGPDYGGVLKFFLWLLIAPTILFSLLLLVATIGAYPWLLLPVVVILCLWALYQVNR